MRDTRTRETMRDTRTRETTRDTRTRAMRDTRTRETMRDASTRASHAGRPHRRSRVVHGGGGGAVTEIRPGPLALPPGHPDLDALADFDAGVLAPAEADLLQAHVAACARCRAVLAGVHDVPQLLRALPPVRMPADVEARILAALDAERQAQRQPQPGPLPAAPVP